MVKEALNNWGRWGDGDQIGVLNLLMSDEKVLKAFKMVKKGKVYSLAVPLERDGPQYPMFQKTWRTSHWDHFENPSLDIIDDVITMETHSGTHIDALGHVWAEGKFYNGFPSDKYASSRGVGKTGIENVRYIIGRGVMLDIPASRGVEYLKEGDTVTPKDLDAAAKAQKVALEPGDVVMVRTGWYKMFYKDRPRWEGSFPGPDGSIVPWLKEHDACAIGADHPACEIRHKVSSLDEGLPLHRYALRDLGVYILENLDLEELARDKVHEFLFIGAPLRITHATGSPWNPLAII